MHWNMAMRIQVGGGGLDGFNYRLQCVARHEMLCLARFLSGAAQRAVAVVKASPELSAS